MSAFDDLRNLHNALDSAITGWIGFKWTATTKYGKECFDMVAKMRARHYRSWGENCALRARLSRALANEDGVRQMNAIMTEQIERLEQNCGGTMLMNDRQRIAELESTVAELRARSIG